MEAVLGTAQQTALQSHIYFYNVVGHKVGSLMHTNIHGSCGKFHTQARIQTIIQLVITLRNL